MKPQTKKMRFPKLEGIRDYMQDAAETSSRWLNWQIIRAKREVWWETDPAVLSRWSQSIIETEQRLRETTQHENFLKECIQMVRAGHDQAAKSFLPDMIEELISLDREYTRVERTYDTMLAGCPAGPIKSGYLWIRKDPQWYLKSEWLREDCARRGGCCGRQCGCCENPPDARRKKGWGHCTAQCACCNSERGFRMTERDRRRLKPEFDLTVYPWSEYSRETFRAYVWSLD
ncbi:hypothetical protein N7457_003559 [Penicillium paradoxum]|uniref:uncharacterized protein n=1 Tax=Penicillium paradoxum TaxID=176176 RepID=UPI002547F3C9|nr:uncharacterized protein N7457_003559 [Penicillium paradoxum]KAJ5788569.1 hypothetical protein N7457_003559 [Penicillium paradoxum]